MNLEIQMVKLQLVFGYFYFHLYHAWQKYYIMYEWINFGT